MTLKELREIIKNLEEKHGDLNELDLRIFQYGSRSLQVESVDIEMDYDARIVISLNNYEQD